MSPSTRSERLQERQEITTEIFGVVLGLLRKMLKFDTDIQTYVSIAGDDEPEMRRTVGLFAVQRERRIDLKIERARQNIQSCITFALKAVIPEERDHWNRKTGVHIERIEKLKVEKTAVKRILVMELPWPQLIRTALGVARTSGNTQLMDRTTHDAISDALRQMGETPAPLPPGASEEGSSPPQEETRDIDIEEVKQEDENEKESS